MPILGLKPIYLFSEEYCYRTLTYLAVSEHGTELYCSQYQSFAAEPQKFNLI